MSLAFRHEALCDINLKIKGLLLLLLSRVSRLQLHATP